MLRFLLIHEGPCNAVQTANCSFPFLVKGSNSCIVARIPQEAYLL